VYTLTLNNLDGQVITKKRYCFPSPPVMPNGWGYTHQNFKMVKTGTGFTVFGKTGEIPKDFMVVRLNSNLDVEDSKIFYRPSSTGSSSINVSPSGEVSFSATRGAIPRFYFSTYNPATNAFRQRVLRLPAATRDYYYLEGGQRIGFKNGSTTFIHHYNENNREIAEFVQLNKADESSLNCMGEDTTFTTVGDFPLTTSMQTPQALVNMQFVSTDLQFTTSNAYVMVNNDCSQASTCTLLKLQVRIPFVTPPKQQFL